MWRAFMLSAMRRSLATLRARLILASLLAMTVLIAIGLLTWRTATAARDAAAAAQRSYERVALYTRLDDAATDFEAVALAAMGGQARGTIVFDARRRLTDLLSAVAATRFGKAAQDADRPRIVLEGRALLDALDNPEAASRRLEAIDRAGGPRAVGAEVSRLRAPYDGLRRDIGVQIANGDAEVAAGAARAMALDQALTRAAFLGLGAVLLMTAALTLTLLRRLESGLGRLELGARALGAGELDHRIALGGRDELAALSGAFDAMAAELQSQQAALKAANSNLEAAVAERTSDLSRANSSLAEEDRRRRAFMAYVGHELRTPLTIIRGEAQVALRAADARGVDPAPVLGRILEQTRDLERLVDDLFLIARAESGGLKLHKRLTDLSELTRRVAGDFEALAAEDRAVIRAAPSAVVEALVDPDRVRQMMAALIDNALRHTRPGVNVEVAADTWEGAPRIIVRDDGPGVPPEQAEDLFTRFRRGDNARGQGSGLGLAVVRALAEAHGGSAGLESPPEGGACAWLRFPALHLAGPP